MGEHRHMEKELRERLQFETLLSDLSAIFVNLPADQVDDQIEGAIHRIVELLDFDRGTLFKKSEDNATFIPSHVWVKPGHTGSIEWLPEEKAPWISERIRQGRALKWSCPEELPAEAARDKEFLKDYGNRSQVIVPLVAGGTLVGTLTLCTLAESRSVSDDVVNRMGLIGGIFAGALERKRAEQALKLALSQVQELKDQLQAENVYLHTKIQLNKDQFAIIGQSAAIQKVLRQIEHVASTDATVLVTGETGTGKELVARAVHEVSARKALPMICVNCASLPPSLIESELFGREKGAFTGAVAKQVGRFEIANGSTLLLDEIGDFPMELQAKLLRVLEDGQFERLGNSKSIKVDARLIASTNRNLLQAVREGQFRADLYYRLNVFPIVIPALRERQEDIPLLVWSFVEEFSKRFNKPIESVSRNDMNALQQYIWPGNVRELRNVVERAVILHQGRVLRIPVPNLGAEHLGGSSSAVSLEQVERDHIIETLKKTKLRVSGENGAAKMLNINPKTLESRMKKLGIVRGDSL